MDMFDSLSLMWVSQRPEAPEIKPNTLATLRWESKTILRTDCIPNTLLGSHPNMEPE